MALLPGKIDKYEYLTGEEMLPSVQSKLIEEDNFTYLPLSKIFEKQRKTIGDQGKNHIKVIEEHGKQLVETSYNTFEGKKVVDCF